MHFSFNFLAKKRFSRQKFLYNVYLHWYKVNLGGWGVLITSSKNLEQCRVSLYQSNQYYCNYQSSGRKSHLKQSIINLNYKHFIPNTIRTYKMPAPFPKSFYSVGTCFRELIAVCRTRAGKHSNLPHACGKT